jgi:hypothetical protein
LPELGSKRGICGCFVYFLFSLLQSNRDSPPCTGTKSSSDPITESSFIFETTITQLANSRLTYFNESGAMEWPKQFDFMHFSNSVKLPHKQGDQMRV